MLIQVSGERMSGTYEIYDAVDQLIGSLRSAGQSKLANILYHRLHVAAWTTSSELLEELQVVLNDALNERDVISIAAMHDQVEQLQAKIKAVLGEPR
jgi:hypothetical protein